MDAISFNSSHQSALYQSLLKNKLLITTGLGIVVLCISFRKHIGRNFQWLVSGFKKTQTTNEIASRTLRNTKESYHKLKSNDENDLGLHKDTKEVASQAVSPLAQLSSVSSVVTNSQISLRGDIAEAQAITNRRQREQLFFALIIIKEKIDTCQIWENLFRKLENDHRKPTEPEQTLNEFMDTYLTNNPTAKKVVDTVKSVVAHAQRTGYLATIGDTRDNETKKINYMAENLLTIIKEQSTHTLKST